MRSHLPGYPWLVLACLFTGLAAVAATWLAVDRHPYEWDHASHLERVLRCHETVAAEGAASIPAVIAGPELFYPPLVFCTAGLLYFVFPVSAVTAQAVIVGFLGLGMLGVFGLGRRVADGGTGLLAAFLFGTAPFVVYSMLNFQVDLPLASVVAVALYALVRTEDFSRPGWSLIFGLVCGAGLLVKPSFPVYVVAPAAWIAWRAARDPGRRRRLGWLALALVVTAAIALPWYGPRLPALPGQLTRRSFDYAAQEGHLPVLTSTALVYYLRVFPSQFGWLAVAAFTWGLWAIRSRLPTRAVLWLAALAPVVVFTLIQNKNLRYSLPALGAAAVVAAAGARTLPPRGRRLATAALGVLGCLQVSMSAFAVPSPPTVPTFPLPIAIPYPPSRSDWEHDRILADVIRESGGRPATLAVVPNHAHFSKSSFSYAAAERRLPLRVKRLWEEVPRGAAFIVLKTGSQGPKFAGDRTDRIVSLLERPGSRLAEIFPLVAAYSLPDQSRAELRARRIPPVTGIAPEELARRLETAAGHLLDDYFGEARSLRARVDYQPDAILRGEVESLIIEADTALVGELTRRDRPALRVRDVRATLRGLVLDPASLVSGGRVEVLDLHGLDVDRLTITQEDMGDLLRRRRRGPRLAMVFDEGVLRALVTGWGPPIELRARLLPGRQGAPLTLAVDQATMGGILVPDPLVSWIVRSFDPMPRLRQLPLAISVAPVTVKPGRLEVGRGSSAGAPPSS
jgi:hypothetical protein